MKCVTFALVPALSLLAGCATLAGQRADNPAPVVYPDEASGMLVGQNLDGLERVCYYNRMSEPVVITVRRTWPCPASIHYDLRSVVQARVR